MSGPAEHVADVLASVDEQRSATIETLVSHHETHSGWLTDAIQTCKRKILEGTGLEITEPKRMKPTTSDKENVVGDVENVMTSKVPAKAKKGVLASAVKKTVPASMKKKTKAVPASVKKKAATSKKPPASQATSNPNYLRIMSLKVVELREELRQRGLDTAGLKKVLQKRLLDDLAEAEGKPPPQSEKPKQGASDGALREAMDDGDADVLMKDAPSEVIDIVDVEMGDEKLPVQSSDVPMADVDMKSNTTKGASRRKEDAKEVLEQSSKVAKTNEPEQVVEEITVTKSFLKSTAELFSPSKITSKIQTLTHQPPESSPSAPRERVPKSDANQTRRGSLADGLVKTASAILSASPAGKPKPAQSNKSKGKSKQVPAEQQPTIEKMTVEAPKQAANKTTKSQAQSQESKPIAPVSSTAGAATKAKRNQATKARMARLAEIRGKSKPVAGSIPGVTSDLPALSASKKLKLGSAKDSKNDRKVLLAAQMREKAAAGLKSQHSSKVLSSSKAKHSSSKVLSSSKALMSQQAVAKVQTSSHTAPKITASPSKALSSSKMLTSQQAVAKVQTGSHTAPKITASPSTALSSSKALTSQQAVAKVQTSSHTAPKITASPKVVVAKKKPASTPSAPPRSVSKAKASSSKKAASRPDILSPMSTYEISDREQSDTDDDSDSEYDRSKKKKKVPRWAQRSNLLPALERQYANEDGRLDPETIFPPVNTCNLEEIFDQKKSRYKKRTSSANWAKDGVTVQEIVAYKRTMGY